MATIESGTPVMTLVNIFTVAPEQQAKLADLLIRATNDTMRHRPGFVSASIHRSTDGTKVINYAQWRSAKDFQAMRDDPDARDHMQAAARLASFEPIICEVVESISAPGKSDARA